MGVIKVQKGQIIAKRNDKVKEIYVIQEGSVSQKLDFAEISLGKNAIIGILARDSYACDYIAKEDTTVISFPCQNVEDLKKLLAANQRYRSNFLYAAVVQRHQAFALYSDLQMRVKKFQTTAQTLYQNYKNLCAEYQLDAHEFQRMDSFGMLKMEHTAAEWQFNNSVSLVKNYLKPYIQFMEQDSSLCVGAIMDISAQAQTALLGIGEMTAYLEDNKDILLSESENDMFQLYFGLAVRVCRRQLDLAAVKKELSFLTDFVYQIKLYDQAFADARVKQYTEYDFDGVSMAQRATGIDVASEDCLGHILEYAEYTKEEIETIRGQIDAYCELPDKLSTDSQTYKIRKQLSPMFYNVYSRVFMHAVKHEETMSPIIEMFLNFGFMDVRLTGEENARALYDLTGRLGQFKSERVYTIYEWLKSIYLEKNEPSKNEFDLDYPAYLAEQRKNGDLTKEQTDAMQNDPKEKVLFEIMNMFTAAHRITSGKITTFCPILNEYDLAGSLDKLSVTAKKVEDALDKVREVDFSIFYREVQFRGPGLEVMNQEKIMLEILPNIILMPNAGTRAMMWQETAGKRRDTPARFLFSIFTVSDLEDQMVETVGRFRWEMCRKIQGVRWNDIREKSLTSEYCDYLQFYRKNRDLSVEAREKLKLAIARAKNSYREVFTADYLNWVKFESNGSFRLNKVARDILVQYCPFSKAIRANLKVNPTYQNSITKFEMDNAKKVQRLNALYDKYQKAGGALTQEMKGNLLFYQL